MSMQSIYSQFYWKVGFKSHLYDLLLPQDYVKSHKWFNIAGDGNEIERRNADVVEKKMTPGQIDVVVGLTRKWLEKF